jgi:hypothetical protein
VISAHLKEAKAAGEIAFAPSPSALSKAMCRRGPEVRKTLALKAGHAKKVLLANGFFLLIFCLLLLLQVLGEPHQHLHLLNELHQNYRSYIVRTEMQGQVGLTAYDDLEKMPLDQLAYNGKNVMPVDAPFLASSSNYSNGRKLIFTCWMVLTLHTKANADRLRSVAAGGKRHLKRHNTKLTSIPLTDRQRLTAEGWNDETDPLPNEVKIAVTDRSGITFVVVKAYGVSKKAISDGGEGTTKQFHAWSQGSTALQHVEDLLLVFSRILRSPAQYEKLSELLLHCGNNNVDDRPPIPPAERKAAVCTIIIIINLILQKVPWLILTSDGASDQNVKHLQNVLPLWELFVLLDLDGLEKWNYCPGHSKANPAERPNGTVKNQFRGRYLESKSDSKEHMELVKNEAARFLEGVTHAGERIYPFVQPAVGIPYTEQESQRGFQQQDERQRFEVTINSYAELYSFAKARKKYAKNWRTENPPEHVVQSWSADTDPLIATYAMYEEKVQQLKRHITFHCLYGIIITKCFPDDRYEDTDAHFEPCDHCKLHPPRGRHSISNERSTNTTCSEETPCNVSPCIHELNAEWNILLATMESLKAPKHKCGICRQEGHDRRVCPQAEK